VEDDGRHSGGHSYFPFRENFVTTLLYCSGKVAKRRRIETVVLKAYVDHSTGYKMEGTKV
jgi:hypothetical protein